MSFGIEEVVQAIEGLTEAVSLDIPWLNFAPQVKQSDVVSTTLGVCQYRRSGWVIDIQANITIAGAGTSGQPIYVQNIPTDLQPIDIIGGGVFPVGRFCAVDQGTSFYTGFVTWSTSNQFELRLSGNYALLGQTPAWALASSDILCLNCRYKIDF